MSSRSMIAALRASAVTTFLLTVSTSGADAAQTTPIPGAGAGTEIIFLGTAGGPPLRLDRSEPSTLLAVDGQEYLIDCGIGTIRRMVEAGIRSEQVRTIFLTHLHADHDLGLANVMANDFLYEGPAEAAGPINIYGPPQTKELVDAAFRFVEVGFRAFAAENPAAYHTADGQLTSPFTTHEFAQNGVIFQDNKVEVTAVENSHYTLMPARSIKEMKSYSYRIRTPYGLIVFTGDSGPSDELVRVARDADVLVAESSSRDSEDLDKLVNSMATRFHWSPERTNAFRAHFEFEHLDTRTVGELATKAGVRSVVLYHYDPANKLDQAAYVREVKKHFAGAVFAPDDLDRYCMTEGIILPCPDHSNQPR